MKHKAPLFGALAAVLIAAGFWYLLYQPKNEELELIQADIAQLESQQATLRNEVTRLEALQASEFEILAEMARLDEFIPAGTAQPAVVRQFQESADAAGVTITSVNFGAPVPVEGAPATGDPDTVLAQIPVTMIMDGGYFQAVDFLRRIEVDVPRALLLQRFTMGEGEAEGQFASLATTWSGQLFAVVPVVPGPAPAPAESEDGDEEAADEDAGGAGTEESQS